MKDRITVTIIWHDHRKPLILTVSTLTLKILFFVSTMFIFLLPVLLLWGALKHEESDRLRAQKEHILKERERLEEQILKEKKRLEEEAQRLAHMEQKLKTLEKLVLDIQSYLRERGIRLEKVRPMGGGSSYKPSYEDSLDALLHLADRTYKTLREIPLGYPVEGNITSRFGWRKNPFGKGYEFHAGVDIEAPYGTPVVATADGQVIFAGMLSDYGKTVILKHPSGYQTLYAHLSSIEVIKGQKVKAGQVIGRVGSTGRSTGPHLHYEILIENKSIDPIKFLSWR